MTQSDRRIDAALAPVRPLQTEHECPAANAMHVPVAVAGISNVAFGDASFFDVQQFFDAKSADRALASKYFQKEAEHIRCLQDVLAEGRKIVYTLYAFRSCGRAMPQVQTHNQDRKEALYQKSFEILRPEIARMMQLMAFRDKFIQVFTQVLTAIIPDIRERDVFPSETFLLVFAQILDLCVSLDTMKNMKGSMNNDLSMYKRALSSFPKDQLESELLIIPKLAFFLAQQDQFAIDVKKSISSVSSTYEDILHDMINLCVDHIESEHYLTPSTKYIYLRAMAFAVCLLDGEGEERDITKRKKLKLDKLGKIFKSNPFSPLFGDIVISLQSIYGKAPHLGGTKWDLVDMDDAGKAALMRSYKITTYLQAHRIEYRHYMGYAKMEFVKAAEKLQGKSGMLPEIAQSVYGTTLSGLRLLSKLTTRVLDQTAYKFLHPAAPSADASIPQDATSYELAVRYNYDAQDKAALVEYIAMIKNIARLFNTHLPVLQEAVDLAIYRDVQYFLKGNVTHYLASASKKKRSIAGILKYIRDVGIDGSVDDEAAQKGVPQTNDLGTRADPISLTQLYFTRSLMDFAFNEKSKGMKGGLIKEKNFKDSQVAELQLFFDNSFFYPVMMKLSETIRECSDLSNLWFKEFYLELSKQVQFPISTSLPWILTEFILDSNRADTIQYLFYPFDLYDDAGHRTLHDLQSRVIFDEIEAEVNLCFDQFMFKLGQRIFVHYKKAASLLVLPSDLNIELESFHRHETIHPNSYEFVLKQTHFELLGRSINVSNILAQIVNQYLHRCIDVAIVRYESSDLFYISELDSLLQSAKHTHTLLSKYLDLERFEDILAECDESLDLGATNGRILSHTIHELVNDIIPNFCYNSVTHRFMRSPVFYTEPIQRPHFPKTRPMYLFGSKVLGVAFTAHHMIFKEFFGEPQFRTMLRLIGPTLFGVISAEIGKHVELIIQHTMNPYMESVYALCPEQFRLKPLDAGIAESIAFFTNSYKPLIHHGVLKSEILQAFREVGNSILVVKTLNEYVTMKHAMSKICLREFVTLEPGQKAFFDMLKDFDQKLGLKDTPMVMTLQSWTERVQDLERPSTHVVTFLHHFVEQTRKALDDAAYALWGVCGAENRLVGSSRSFAHIWSAVLFVACVPSVAGHDRFIRELFGDGLAWAGCLFLHILDKEGIHRGIDINGSILATATTEIGCPWPPHTMHHASQQQQQQSAATAAAKCVEAASQLEPDVQRFLDNAAHFENVGRTAFAVLKALRV